jgi:hypothetical protein
VSTIIAESLTERSRQRELQALGVFCGLAAALWLAAAEAPTKLVTVAVSPLVISFMIGAFVSRWSLPALIRGTSDIGADVREAPHLVVWGILAGCLWAVGWSGWRAVQAYLEVGRFCPYLSMPSRRIFDSSVWRAIPSFAAAPEGPEIRP